MKKDKQNPHEWVKEGKHLPKVLQDFHDQKDIFHAIWANREENAFNKNLNPTSTHIFTVDEFLFFMAKHGYTMQKSRANVEFKDLHTTVQKNREEMYANSPLMKQLKKDAE